MATLLEKCNNIKNDKELNLKPENLKAGVTCLGVTGTLEELDTSNATATASDIADGKTAYVNGELITGNVFTVGSNANYGGMGNLTVEDDANYSRIEVKHRFNMKTLFTEDGKASFYPSYDSVAEAIGLTADQILKGNTVLGIEGVAEAGDNSNIKVFNTVEEMNAVEDGQEGDLAIIYGYRWTQMSHDLAFNAMEFPDTIELTEPVPDWANSCYFAPAAYETENSAAVIVSYDTSAITVNFRMDAAAAEETFITYTSTDGLFFTADRADNRILNLPNDVMATSIDVWILDHNKIAKINAKTADIYMFYEDYGMTGWENISNTTNSQGIDTSDATATSENIEPGYSAYTKDGLVHGNMTVAEGLTIDSEYEKESPEYRLFYDAETNKVQQIYRNTYKTLILEGTEMDVRFTGKDIAEVIGLTPDKIVEGNTILGISGTAKVSTIEFDTFVNNLTKLQTAMDNALIAAKSDEAIRGNNRANAQLYNFIARGGYEVLPEAENGDEKWLIQSDATAIPCNLIKREYTETSQLGTPLPITTVTTSYGDNELPSYFVTPKGKVFCYPGFTQGGKTYVAPTTVVTDESGNEVNMTQLIPTTTKITLDNGEVIYINNEQVERAAPELLRSFSTQFPNLATDPSIWYNGMVVSDNGVAMGYTFEGYLNNTKQY